MYCQYLEWDSAFFGRRIASILPNRLKPDELETVFEWCTAEKIDCLYFLSDSNDRDTVRLVEENAFRLMDIRLTLERRFRKNPLGPASSDTQIRLAQSSDIPDLQAIARVSHHDSRFFYDPHFPDELCTRFYETWIAKSCEGYADAVLVADIDGQAAGYISCHLGDDGTGKIGLLAVKQEAQGNGFGKRLVDESLRWFCDHQVHTVSVVTQGRNAVAQLLYQQCGFLTSNVQLWYHRWFID